MSGVSRRRLLGLVGAGATTALAGCSGASSRPPSGEGSAGPADRGTAQGGSNGSGGGGTGCTFANHAPYAGELSFSFAFDQPDGWETGILLDNESMRRVRVGRPSTELTVEYAHYLEVLEESEPRAAEDDLSSGDEAQGFASQTPLDYGGTEVPVSFNESGPREGPDSQGIYTWRVGLPASDPDTVTPVTVAGLADGTDEYPACLMAVRAAGEATVRSIRPK